MPVDSLSQVLGIDGLEQTEHVERVFLLKTVTFPSIGTQEPFLDLIAFAISNAAGPATFRSTCRLSLGSNAVSRRGNWSTRAGPVRL
jgi:hypothetical protein